MNLKEAKDILYDAVFNGEYQVSDEQKQAWYTIFRDTINHPEYVHKITPDIFKKNGWAKLVHGDVNGDMYELFTNVIDDRRVTVTFELSGAIVLRTGCITAHVETVEDIEQWMDYDDIDYELKK